MPAKKDSRLLHGRINELLNRIANLDREADPDLTQLNLGTREDQLSVSLESFFQFNFDLSCELEEFIEEKMLDEYQKEWNEWEAGEPLAKQPGRLNRNAPQRPK